MARRSLASEDARWPDAAPAPPERRDGSSVVAPQCAALPGVKVRQYAAQGAPPSKVRREGPRDVTWQVERRAERDVPSRRAGLVAPLRPVGPRDGPPGLRRPPAHGGLPAGRMRQWMR